jgi:hypothetical protein
VVTCTRCRQAAPFCDACFEQQVMWKTSHAQIVGRRWGGGLRRRSVVGEWLAWDDPLAERLRTVAYRKVATFAAGDDRLHEHLAKVCAEAAADAFENATPPVGIAFTVKK